MFTLEEVECIGACSWAPGGAGELRFSRELTVDKMDRFMDECEKKATQ